MGVVTVKLSLFADMTCFGYVAGSERYQSLEKGRHAKFDGVQVSLGEVLGQMDKAGFLTIRSI